MELSELERHWDAFGDTDPLWSILSAPGKRGGAWDLEEFLATGRTEISAVLERLAADQISLGHGRALDFGCGVGRLTRALGSHFERCDGVDVARSMVERARSLNTDAERIVFHHNEAPDLALFPDATFDFVLSLLVLQHMEPGLMRGYIGEFLRVLRVGAVAFFNVPERRIVAQELPVTAYRAQLATEGAVPAMTAGQTGELAVRVRNTGSAAWPADAQLRVGNHWRSADGTTELVQDDGRSDIGALAPGEEELVALQVNAPREPGEYQLELDVVQEWVAWFATRGSTPLRLAVQVMPGSLENPAAVDAAFVPTMEMHTMSREEVAAVVEESGGVVLAAQRSHHSLDTHPIVDYVVLRVRPFGGAGRRETSTTPLRAGLHRLDPDLTAFTPTSRRSGVLGAASVASRRLLQRALLEVLHRQSTINAALTSEVENLRRDVDRLS